MNDIKNLAIIAHVDHGKTTLIDNLLKQCGIFRDNQEISERIMDSNDLEKERGITILAKPTSIIFQNTRINIIDTPGHADFGGEVERVLSMVDGVILLIDSSEGPMHLFVSLDANTQQLDFPVLYASGRSGWCVNDLSDDRSSLTPLLNKIISHVPSPDVDNTRPFAMLSTLLDYDPYLGRCLIGRVEQGSAKINDSVHALNLSGKIIETGRLTKLLKFEGTKKITVNSVNTGDIVCIAGLSITSVSDTICSTDIETPIKSTPIDPPTMSINIMVNDSPLAGTEGKKLTSTQIRERLVQEAQNNVGISFSENENKDSFEISGRGELMLEILLTQMRREGFEMTVSPPRVLFQKNENGEKLEPIEEITMDLDEEFSSKVIDSMNKRKGKLIDLKDTGKNKKRLIFHAPTRGLMGYTSRFLTLTKGTGVINRIFHSYGKFEGDMEGRRNGALISMEQGKAVAFAIYNLQARGEMFVTHNDPVYSGMIVGLSPKPGDMIINVMKGKKLTNMRTQGTDENVVLTPVRKMSIAEQLSMLNSDEALEITPNSCRLRKAVLDPHERKKLSKLSEAS